MRQPCRRGEAIMMSSSLAANRRHTLLRYMNSRDSIQLLDFGLPDAPTSNQLDPNGTPACLEGCPAKRSQCCSFALRSSARGAPKSAATHLSWRCTWITVGTRGIQLTELSCRNRQSAPCLKPVDLNAHNTARPEVTPCRTGNSTATLH